MVVEPGVTGDRHAVGVAQHRRCMAVLDVVVAALFAARIPGEPAGLTELGESVTATGDDLVHVRLVAGVPEDGVGR